MLEHDSRVLADNPLGDPHIRKLAVWLPPGYDEGACAARRGRGRRYPVLFDLVGFTGSGLAHLNWRPFDENVPERAARLIAEKRMGPCIVVFPDCFTCLGGNQYINSSAIGRYADYLTREMIPLRRPRVPHARVSRDHRGCFGKSSGGYGAMIHGMQYAEHWGAIGNHSGDAYFEFCYLPDWPRTLNELDRYRQPRRTAGRQTAACAKRRASDGTRRRPRPALPRGDVGEGQAQRRGGARADGARDGRQLRPRPARADGLPPAGRPRHGRAHRAALGTLARARSGQSRAGVHAESQVAARASTSIAAGATSITCTSARASSRASSRAHGIAHTYEEFDDTHSSIDYRMDVSLPFLYRALKP